MVGLISRLPRGLQGLWLHNASGSNLEYGSHDPDAPKVFLTDVDFPNLWNGAGRVFLVCLLYTSRCV